MPKILAHLTLDFESLSYLCHASALEKASFRHELPKKYVKYVAWVVQKVTPNENLRVRQRMFWCYLKLAFIIYFVYGIGRKR